ncbi:DUF6584 family protein [Kitasatospora sp. NPDC089797]|uniref:DUF6584 family protein n=1 Tax=Kitasatospora sp. NPDC089797 TaxID=3155298 RepID=UPI003430AF18
MTVEATLARVDADLRAGRIPVARQRLRGLVVSCPTDLTVRRRLAEVYRLYGEPAQAGRWAYLEADRDPAETAAFEDWHRDPLDRMAAVAWRGPEEAAATAATRERLAALREAASAHAGRPVDWLAVHAPAPAAEEEPRDLWCAGFFVVALVAAGFAVLGLVTFVRWWL